MSSDFDKMFEAEHISAVTKILRSKVKSFKFQMDEERHIVKRRFLP